MPRGTISPPYLTFARPEFESRIERTRLKMAEAGLDSLFITSEHNFRYLTGYILQSPVQQARPRFFVVPLAGEPCAVVPQTNLVGMRRTTWVSDIRTWAAPNPTDDGVTLLAEVLKSFAGKYGRVGAELGPESRLGMPVLDFLWLRELIGPSEFVDAARLCSEVRMTKSPAEIERIRDICAIVSDGFEALPSQLEMGDTEWSACWKLQLDLTRRGAHRTFNITGVSGHQGYDNPNTGPTARPLGAGDILFIDTGCSVDNYWCDFDRHFAFGPPSDVVRRAYDTLYRATDAGIEAAAPGRRACDLWKAMMSVIENAGAPASSIGRMGHGIGLLAPEPPSINATDETQLERGMVVTLEPSLSYEVAGTAGSERKMMVHEENLVITAAGCELLSRRAPREIPVIS
jgi:Xaa-Pro dipeptidase